MFKGIAIFASLLVFGAIGSLTAGTAHAASDPIQVKQCFIKEPKPLSKLAGGTQIDYVNKGSKTASSVTFQIAYRNAASHFLRRVTDVGQFQPGVEINHSFALYNDVTYAGKSVQSCAAVAVHWIDGTRWP